MYAQQREDTNSHHAGIDCDVMQLSGTKYQYDNFFAKPMD
jgi:hypothetical protein